MIFLWISYDFLMIFLWFSYVFPKGWADAATGPLNQATGPPQSDAGVGIGMLIGDRDFIARK